MFAASARGNVLGNDGATIWTKKETFTETQQEGRRLMEETPEPLSILESMQPMRSISELQSLIPSTGESKQKKERKVRPLLLGCVGERKSSGRAAPRTCPICWTNPANSDPYTCVHKFCKDCVREWQKQPTGNGKCPMCRSPPMRTKVEKCWECIIGCYWRHFVAPFIPESTAPQVEFLSINVGESPFLLI